MTKQEFGINVRVAGGCQMMESAEGLSASASGFMRWVGVIDPGEWVSSGFRQK